MRIAIIRKTIGIRIGYIDNIYPIGRLNNSNYSQLTGGNISGNLNIIGNPASLILNQVTSNNGSFLVGTAEVVGNQAGIIIANPNGITCSGCSFINSSGVHLVTGISQFSNNSFTGFDLNNNGSINITGNFSISGDATFTGYDFESKNSAIVRADNLVIDARNNFYNSDNAEIRSDNLNITTNYGFTNQNNATINADDLFINVLSYYGAFYNQETATISADSIDILANNSYFYNTDTAIIQANDFNVTVDSFFNEGDAVIDADNFIITANGGFYNIADVSATHLNITTNFFANRDNPFFGNASGNITADTFTLSVAGYFDYAYDFLNNGNIYATSLNLRVGGDFAYDDANNDFVWFVNDSLEVLGDVFVAADNFYNYGEIEVASNFNVTANRFYNYTNSSISADNLSIVGSFFDNDNSTLKGNNLDIVVSGNFYNSYNATIDANNLDISTGYFFNTFDSVTGNIIADTFALSVSGDFDYAADYLNNGNIDATNQYFTARNGNFINNTTIVLVGDLGVTADNFINLANISVSNFNVTVGDDFANYNNATINADNFNVTAEIFFNEDNVVINADNFNVTADDFYNQDSATINANDFNVTANRFYNYTNSSISADNLSIVGSFFDNDNSTLKGNNLDIVVSGNFYNSYNANIDANNLDISTGYFFNTFEGVTGNIIADTFTLSVAGDFDYATNYLNNGNIDANNLNFTARDGVFSNDKTISLINGKLGITANNFINTGSIIANTFALSVAGDFDYASDFLNNGNIDATNQYFTARDGDFTNSTTIALVGDLGVTADNFINLVNISVSNFNVAVLSDFINHSNATINANNFNVTAGDDFFNRGNATINANDFSVTVGDNFYNYSGATIIADDFSVLVAGNFTNQNNAKISAVSFSVTADGIYTNNGRIDSARYNDETYDVQVSYYSTTGTSSEQVIPSVASGGDDILSGSLGIASYSSSGTVLRIYYCAFHSETTNSNGNYDCYDWDYLPTYYSSISSCPDSIAYPISVNGVTRYYCVSSQAQPSTYYSSCEDGTNSKCYRWSYVNTYFKYNTEILTRQIFSHYESNSLNIKTGEFYNGNGAYINADTFALSVAGDFDYVADFNGTIDFNSLNINVVGNFSNNDANNDFTWGANDSLTVLAQFHSLLQRMEFIQITVELILLVITMRLMMYKYLIIQQQEHLQNRSYQVWHLVVMTYYQAHLV